MFSEWWRTRTAAVKISSLCVFSLLFYYFFHSSLHFCFPPSNPSLSLSLCVSSFLYFPHHPLPIFVCVSPRQLIKTGHRQIYHMFNKNPQIMQSCNDYLIDPIDGKLICNHFDNEIIILVIFTSKIKQNIAGFSFLNVMIWCFSLSVMTINWIFWGFWTVGDIWRRHLRLHDVHFSVSDVL